MELKTQEGSILISKEEKAIYDELISLAHDFRNKFFFCGRMLDKFVKLSEQLKK